MIAGKILHQGRVSFQQKASNAYVDYHQLRSFVGYAHDEQDESYLRKVKLQPLLFGAGQNFTDAEQATVVHLTPTANQAVDDGYNQLMTRFVEQEDAVKAELHKPGQTFEQAKKDCLFAASGCLKFIRLCVSLYIRGAAARPRGAKGEIVADSPTLNEMFKGRNRVDGLAYFRSNQFKEVKGLIRAAEEVLTTHSTHSLTHSTHSYYSLAIRSHTHSPTHTQYPLKYPYTHNAHTQYSHTVLTHNTLTQHSHTVLSHTHSTYPH